MKGTIYKPDVERYDLPSGTVEMTANGCWTDGKHNITSYELEGYEAFQFYMDRHHIFYVETADI